MEPLEYKPRQTMKNAERFITPELKRAQGSAHADSPVVHLAPGSWPCNANVPLATGRRARLEGRSGFGSPALGERASAGMIVAQSAAAVSSVRP